MMKNPSWADFREWSTVQACLRTGRIPNTDAEWEFVKHTDWTRGVRIIGEFGAGYGPMAKMILREKWTDGYHIYDFPELIRLQKWFLSDNGMDLEKIVFCETPEEWERLPQVDLLISICAMSEAPVDVRWPLLNANPKSLLIRSQFRWLEIDNHKFFIDMAKERYEYMYFDLAPEYSNHFHLIAWNLK